MLGHIGVASRAEIKKMVKQGRVTVDGLKVKDSGLQVNPDQSRIEVDGEAVLYREYVYLMLHKPAGVVSATEDNRDKTVIDLLPDEYRTFSPFPVGRLDKDTEGLLLLTNDGALSHELLSPRKHVPKTYEADVAGEIGDSHRQRFAAGVELDDGYLTKPAELHVLEHYEKDGQSCCRISLTIVEGKFHQVKRMFEAVGSKVLYLKRVSMGTLTLDPELPKGAFRELTEEELYRLQHIHQKENQ
ncbi:16S rRNA pseudouridine synthase [Paenibacillus yonginensis]|uniref:Pseudouridine synthase n=1 Tax=Paenibacillus yonginensis TaxID=1462996 RepID=A0A1B1N6M0_9BACL|nr:pseudouridine synthase [Paenibacillus yonginensis]ANS77088.1 16S rRNA pseudouridine synthase [Paenibacillus yonginensis]